jgi:hypothetical protein
MADGRKKAPEYPVETRQVTYLPAGVAVDPYEGNEPTLDPKLAKIREDEIKANDVKIDTAPKEPTIDPALVKAREDEIKRDAKRAGVNTSPPKPTVKKSSK